MDLLQKISDDLKNALKSGDQIKISTLRMVLSSLHNKEIEKKTKGEESKLTDEEIISVLSSESKKRRDSIEAYTKGNRPELADKEQKELECVKAYLPEQLSEDETRKIVQEKIKELEINGPKDFGKAMGVLMKELKGKADAGLVSQFLNEELKKNE
ncbi:MAG: GatB/YqeY domain-containing protein [Candidatus Paceibacterota bacterium]|jgi:hypothetical protein